MRKLIIAIFIWLLMPASILSQVPQYTMAETPDEMQGWNRYPTYGLYCQMMEQWASQYAGKASLVEVGSSVRGRRILGIRLTSPGDTTMRTPVLISSSIHGNETTGYLLSLRLIDSLCRADAAQGSRLLERCVLYIVPLANPDGTYSTSQTTVSGATRENANRVDLNRNFGSISPEPETMAMMGLARSRRFAFSVSLHGGDEVVNYPWDSYLSSEMSLPDLEWWQTISQRYVATCRAQDSTYLRSVNQEGHVFGSNWYKVDGGMQDWMYKEMRCRETTIELSNTKTILPEMLDFYWNLTRQALTDFLENAASGFCGSISDMEGNPIEGATILINNHDENFSGVTSRSNGSYFRPTLPQEMMEVCALADGYATQCSSISTREGEMEQLDFRLGKLEATAAGDLPREQAKARITASGDRITVESPTPIEQYQVYNTSGQMMACGKPRAARFEIPAHNLCNGIYVVRIGNQIINKSHKIAILK